MESLPSFIFKFDFKWVNDTSCYFAGFFFEAMAKP
jgi:hypothetical protein